MQYNKKICCILFNIMIKLLVVIKIFKILRLRQNLSDNPVLFAYSAFFALILNLRNEDKLIIMLPRK